MVMVMIKVLVRARVRVMVTFGHDHVLEVHYSVSQNAQKPSSYSEEVMRLTRCLSQKGEVKTLPRIALLR